MASHERAEQQPSCHTLLLSLSIPFTQVLKRVGELFPKGAKATRAYLHTEADVEAALK